jgi:hypothetical protein
METVRRDLPTVRWSYAEPPVEPTRFTGWRVEGVDWQPTPDGSLPADLPRGVIEVRIWNGVFGGRFTIVNAPS